MFVESLHYTNDAAERLVFVLNMKYFFLKLLKYFRCVKAIKDAIGHFHREDNLQQTLLTQLEERKRVKTSRNGQLTKRKLQNILSP